MNVIRVVRSHKDTKYPSGVPFGEGAYTRQATKGIKQKKIHPENAYGR